MSDEPKSSKRRTPTSWYSERLLAVLQGLGIDQSLEEGASCLRGRRSIDFFITPGSITTRLQDETGRLRKISLSMPEIPDDVWNQVFGALAEKALFLAKLLANELPIEVEEVFQNAGAPLLPENSQDILLTCDGEPLLSADKYVAALYFLASERFESDPFSILTFRGRNKESVLGELKKLRSDAREISSSPHPLSYHDVSYQPAPPLGETLERFWSAGDAMRELSYRIRADELPASLLRRLDALPFGELETDVSFALEDAYAQIARRAQALGLGL